MHNIRTLTGSSQNLLDPEYRKVFFDDEPHIVTVVTHIRALWTTMPSSAPASCPSNPTVPDSDTSEPVAATINESNMWSIARRYELNAQHDAYIGLERNPDTRTLDTPWRRKLAETFNHVFVDVMRWLPSVSCSVGHLHPPNHSVFAIPFPQDTSNRNEGAARSSPVLRKCWDTNVLLLPAFLAKGVKIRANIEHEDQEDPPEAEMGVLEQSSRSEIWYLKAGVELEFYVDGDFAGTEGLAAVMAVGGLCNESHGQVSCCEAHGEDKTNQDESEKDRENSLGRD